MGCLTFLLQVLVLLIMLAQGLDLSTTGNCFSKPPSPTQWITLHVSKALAMIVAGTLLGSHLMDIINYWMVADLLLPSFDLETTITAMFRVCLTILILVTNISI